MRWSRRCSLWEWPLPVSSHCLRLTKPQTKPQVSRRRRARRRERRRGFEPSSLRPGARQRASPRRSPGVCRRAAGVLRSLRRARIPWSVGSSVRAPLIGTQRARPSGRALRRRRRRRGTDRARATLPVALFRTQRQHACAGWSTTRMEEETPQNALWPPSRHQRQHRAATLSAHLALASYQMCSLRRCLTPLPQCECGTE
mmetsp:Transcript_9718/g.21740  ORF Transcript_9718/g.21740 Transcript_9718/m.21740 type:complete len:200 (+) Transcript_9718:2504-3103(+)